MAAYKEEELFKAWQAWYKNPKDKALTGELFQKFDPLVRVVINSYLGNKYVNDPLMRGRAKQILYKTLPNYSPDKGPIASYVWTNLQRLQRYLTKQQNVIKLSEADAMAARHLESVEKELMDELGREPTDEELADKLGISVRRIGQLRRRALSGFEGSFEQEDEDSGIGTLPSVQVSLPTKKLAQTLYDATEDTIDKYILERAYGLNGRRVQSLAEIAQSLGRSKSAVSQRLAAINEQLMLLKRSL